MKNKMNDKEALLKEIEILKTQLEQQDRIMKNYGAHMFGCGMAARSKELIGGSPYTDRQLSAILGISHSRWVMGNNHD